MNRYHKPEFNLEDLIKSIYHKRDLKANDVMVTAFCESVLFKINQISYLLLIPPDRYKINQYKTETSIK